MPTLTLLNYQVYQAPESVMMNQSVHYFHYYYTIASKQCHESQLTTCNEPYMLKQKAVFIFA